MIRRLKGPTPEDVREIDHDIVIGRDGVEVEIPDPKVSRRHAVIRPVVEGVEVEDLGSSNGTFINGQRLQGKLTVTKTATLLAGGTEFEIEVELPQATRVRPSVMPPPDVTVQRPIARPEVTSARPQAPPPAAPPSPAELAPSAPPPRPAGPPPPPGVSLPPAAAGGGRANRRSVAIGVGGLVLGALLAVGLIALLGGSSKKTAAQLAATKIAPNCPAHLPPVIHDGFPEPQMRFARNGFLDTSLHLALAHVTVDGQTYATGMEYDHQLPGPMLVICPGDRLEIHLYNGLPLPTNLHLHGMHVSPNGDADNVFVDIKPLTERTYRYQIPLDQSPGFFWYHPHLFPLVDPEEAGGLAGGIWVEGSLDNRLPNVPQRFIIIQGGNRRGPKVTGPAAAEAPPAVGVPPLLVNGVVDPTAHIRPGQLQRWNILNATSDRLLELQMPGVTFQLLAQDGITLRYMRPERQILIGPGSRVAVLVRGGPTGLYTLSALPFHQCLKGCNPFAGPVTGAITPEETLLSMISTGAPANDQDPTGSIGDPTDLRNMHVDVYRTILFTEHPTLKGPPAFLLDHQLYNPNRVDITMKLNSVEEWTLENPAHGAAYEWHTFHIHINPFQVISVNGRPLNYIDWQDNIVLAPGSTTVILIHPIDFTGKFVFHCHVIFHEDFGMMGVVQVVKNPSSALVDVDRTMYLSPPVGQAYDGLGANSVYAGLGTTDDSEAAFLLYCHLLAASDDDY